MGEPSRTTIRSTARSVRFSGNVYVSGVFGTSPGTAEANRQVDQRVGTKPGERPIRFTAGLNPAQVFTGFGEPQPSWAITR